jgi:hypothetical protein
MVIIFLKRKGLNSNCFCITWYRISVTFGSVRWILMKMSIHEEIRKKIGDETACYVLITCGEPSPSGEMNVELSYDGDPVLAEFLIQGAQNYFDEPQLVEQQSSCC